MDEVYDLAVIGGGVNGCGIARDAAGRGLSVYLCEMNDLASDVKIDPIITNEILKFLPSLNEVEKEGNWNSCSVKADGTGHSVVVLPNEVFVHPISFHSFIIVLVSFSRRRQNGLQFEERQVCP